MKTLSHLAKLFSIVVVLFGSAFITSARTTQLIRTWQVGGTAYHYVNGDQQPFANALVLVKVRVSLKAQSGNPPGEEVLFETARLFVAGSDGKFGNVNMPCWNDVPPPGETAWLPVIDTRATYVNDGAPAWSSRSAGTCVEGGDPYVNALFPGGNANTKDLQNFGADCQADIAKPINVTNGNMWLAQTDMAFPSRGAGLELRRTYNSQDEFAGLFGFGWTSVLDEALTPPGPVGDTSHDLISVRIANGRSYYFYGTGNEYASASADFTGKLVRTDSGGTATYKLFFKDGTVHEYYANGRLNSISARDGGRVTLTYSLANGDGNVTGVSDNFGRSLLFTTNSAGRIEKVYDNMSSVSNPIATYGYENGLLKTVAYEGGAGFTFEYPPHASGKILLQKVRDVLGNIVEAHDYDNSARATTSYIDQDQEKYYVDYSHSNDLEPYTRAYYYRRQPDSSVPVEVSQKFYFTRAHGRNLVVRTEGACSCGASGSETTDFKFDDRANLIERTNALGYTTRYAYDDASNLIRQEKFVGTTSISVNIYTYNQYGQPLTWTTPTGGVWTYTYNPTTGNPETIEDPRHFVIQYSLPDAKGLPTRFTDQRGKVALIEWYPTGQLKKYTDANGHHITYAYDLRGRMTSVINPRDEEQTLAYDDSARTRTITFPDGKSIRYAYDLRRLLTEITDERGYKTLYDFDTAYRLTKITYPSAAVPSPNVVTFGYDNNSSLAFVRNALGQQTDYYYDDFGRLSTIDYPSAESDGVIQRLRESLGYDKLGRPKSRLDPAGKLTTFTFNDVARTLTTVSPDAEQTVVTYNADGYMTKVEDAAHQLYVFDPDAMGNVRSIARGTATASFEYDGAGNLTRKTDVDGKVTNVSYDNVGRVKDLSYEIGATTIGGPHFDYDELNRLWKATNEVGTVTMTYDNRGRPASTTDVFGNIVEYAYNRNQSEDKEIVKLNGQIHATYKFDVLRRPQTVTNGVTGQQIGFEFDAANRPMTKSLPNGVVTTYDFDSMGRLKRQHDGVGQDVLFDQQFKYDKRSMVKSIDETAGGSSTLRSMLFDGQNRLKSVSASGQYVSESYSYDAVGNRQSSSLSDYYTYDQTQSGAYNRLVESANPNENGPQVQRYQYDNAGKLVRKSDPSELWTYYWTPDGMLARAASRKNLVRYRYDALGRLVQRSATGKAENTKYVYDGADVMADDNGGGSLTRYINGVGIDEKLSATKSTDATTRYFLSDHLGSTRALTDGLGNVTSTMRYDSFGNFGPQDNLDTRFRFTGRDYDSVTGLYNYRARWYDPKIGRFISEDPIGLSGGVNQYAYVSNSPLSLVDPSGLFQEGWGARFARGVDETTQVAESFYGGDFVVYYNHSAIDAVLGREPQPVYLFASVRALFDMMRVGNGLACALFVEDENIWGRFAYVMKDIKRAADLFVTLAGAAQSVKARVEGPPVGEVPCALCFQAGTDVETDRGAVPIEKIAAGDMVLSYNEQSGKREYREVVAKFTRWADDIYDLSVEGESQPIGVTGEHPFFIRSDQSKQSVFDRRSGEWRETRLLKVGDAILLSSGAWAKVKGVKFRGPGDVFNFTVSGNHTYFVGQSNLLTHNACPRFDANQDAIIQLAKKAKKAGGVTQAEAKTLETWSKEYNLPFRGPEVHPGRPFGSQPHIHVGPIDHLWVK